MFEWDEEKNRRNIEKHGVSFEVARRIFEGLVLTSIDNRDDYGEVRELSVGRVGGVLLLVVVHTARGSVTRLISARKAIRRERRRYEEAS